MNIFDLDNKIYGIKKLKQGEHADFMMKYIEQQELQNMDNNYNFNNDRDNIFNKEIKF